MDLVVAMPRLRENKVPMLKRKIVSKYNNIRQEIEHTNKLFEDAKLEIKEKVAAFLRGGDEPLAVHFTQIDNELELFHSKLCYIQDVLENGNLDLRNDADCCLDSKNLETETLGSIQACDNISLIDSASVSSCQSEQVPFLNTQQKEHLGSQCCSLSVKKINTDYSACAGKPSSGGVVHNELNAITSTTLPSGVTNLQCNNIETFPSLNIRETTDGRTKVPLNGKSNNNATEYLSSSDASSVYGTVSSVFSEGHLAEKSETVALKESVKHNNEIRSVYKQDLEDDMQRQITPSSSEASKQNSVNEDTWEVHHVEHDPNIILPCPDLEIGSHVSATVQNIINPSDFWIQAECERMKDLCPVANNGSYDGLPVVKKNVCCLAPFDRSKGYFRARILEVVEKIPGKPRAKVLYVDLGCKGSLHASTLKVLPPSLQRIPCVSVHCALDGVVPVDGNWSFKAIEEFRKTIELSDSNIFLASRVNNTYFVQICMKASLPGEEMITYTMSEMLCQFKLAKKESSVATSTMQQHMVSSPETSGSVSVHSHSPRNVFTSQALSSNEFLVAESDENVMPVKCLSSSSSVSNKNCIMNNYNSQSEIHHNKETVIISGIDENKSVIVNSEADRRVVVDKFISQCEQTGMTNAVHHQKVVEQNQNVVSESSSGVDGRAHTHKNENLGRNCKVSGADLYYTDHHHVKVPVYDSVPCVTNDCRSQHQLPHSSLDCFDWNVNIPFPSQTFEKKAKLVVMLSAIVCPSDFYVNIAMRTSAQLDDLQEQMLSVYQNFDSSGISLPPCDKLCGMFCCCQFAEDKNWYRVQVLALCTPMETVENSHTKVRIQYIDYGNEATVEVRDLMPLKKEFSVNPPFSYRCSLAGIKPRLPENCSGKFEDIEWSGEAVSIFRSLARNDRCYTAEIAENMVYDSWKKRIPVYLWDTDSTKDMLINSVLVEQGVANGSDMAILNPPPEDNLPDIEKWDPMAADFHSTLNSYGVNTNDPEIATVGYKARDESYVCKFFSATGNCFRGDKCYYQHIYVSGDSTIDKEPVEYLGRNMSLPAVGSAAFVLVSAMYSPGHFYVIFPFGVKSVGTIRSEIRQCIQKEEDIITEFIENMNMYYNRNLCRKENTALAPACGDLVAVKWKNDGRWYRGRVCDVHDVNAPIQVYFIDYGSCELIERKDVFQLEPQFRDFPFQAVECYLYNVEPSDSKKGNTKWSYESRKMFQKMTEGQVMIAKIKSICGASLYIELFTCIKDQKLSINDYLVDKGYGQHSALSCGSQKDKQKENVVFYPA